MLEYHPEIVKPIPVVPRTVHVSTDRALSPYLLLLIIVPIAFIGLSPLLPGSSTVALYDLKRIVQIAILCLTTVAVVAVPNLRRSWLATWKAFGLAGKIVLGVVVIGIISALVSVDPLHGLLEVSHLALLGVLAVAIASTVTGAPEAASRVIVWLIFFAALIYVVMVARDYLLSQFELSYAFRGKPNALWPYGEFLGYAHPRFLSQVQSWLLPVLVIPFLWVRTRSGAVGWLLLLVCMLWWTSALAAGSRGTIVSCVAALLLSAVIFRSRGTTYLWANGLALVGGIALFLLLFKVLGDTPASVDQRDLTSSMGRFSFWQNAIDLARQNPLLGVGPMLYAKFHHFHAVHPHNSFFQFLAEWGAPAALAVASVAGYGLLRLIRNPLEAGDRVGDCRIAATTALLAGLGHSLLSGVFVMPGGQMAAAVLIGWVMGLGLRDTTAGKKSTYPHHTRHRRSLEVSLAAALVAFVIIEVVHAGRSFETMNDRRESVASAGIEHRPLPRFWQWGCLNLYEAESVESMVLIDRR